MFRKETEQWVVATKDMLAPKGYSAFFDVVRAEHSRTEVIVQ
jgi:hypothetical protein